MREKSADIENYLYHNTEVLLRKYIEVVWSVPSQKKIDSNKPQKYVLLMLHGILKKRIVHLDYYEKLSWFAAFDGLQPFPERKP